VVKVIAEIGSNWANMCVLADTLGRTDLGGARAAIRDAAKAGADIVKFQVFTADTLYSKERAPEQWEAMKKYELPVEWIGDLSKTALDCGVKLWASVFNPGLLEKCAEYLDGIKIASGDIDYFELIETAANLAHMWGIPLAISTGAATTEEIAAALRLVVKHGNPDVILMHCVSGYPTDARDMNIRAVTAKTNTAKGILPKVKMGLSDHSTVALPAQLAVALGCEYIEKHFMPYGVTDSPDACVSLNPFQFVEFIDRVRSAEEVLGSGGVAAQPVEAKEGYNARRCKDGLRPRAMRIV
jgi:N,N'-diacetyllegionaminate synthase